MGQVYEYSQYNALNRFSNLDGIEAKIIAHLVHSTSIHAEQFWKLLKYDTDDALNKPSVSIPDRQKLIEGYEPNNTSETADTRLFLSPFVDDAWEKQISSVYIFVDDVFPIDLAKAKVSLTIETVIHSKINNIAGNSWSPTETDKDGNNPNDFYYKDDTEIVVERKSRATTLLKCILAELNGLYIDGVGYLEFTPVTNKTAEKGQARLSLFNRRSFFGHSVQMLVNMSGVSDSAEDDLW